MLLAGDIGGTKTTLALFADVNTLATPVVETTFASTQYPSLEAIIHEFLRQQTAPISRVALGVAGPIIGDTAHVTNLRWQVKRQSLSEQLGGAPVYLLNDLAAIANALPVLPPSDLYTLNGGQALAGGNIAVIAPGTGLGEAFLTWDGARYRAYASEGGHADFAPTDEWEMRLWQYLRNGLGFAHISYEAVCSGLGIPNIYKFVKAAGEAEEPTWLAQALATAADPTPVIVNAALDETRPCEICTVTLDTFIGILGAEAGNLALKVMATGGVYLGGGIPPRILANLTSGRFMEAFCNKGRFAAILRNMPVWVINNPKAGLLGAAYYGFTQA